MSSKENWRGRAEGSWRTWTELNDAKVELTGARTSNLWNELWCAQTQFISFFWTARPWV